MPLVRYSILPRQWPLMPLPFQTEAQQIRKNSGLKCQAPRLPPHGRLPQERLPQDRLPQDRLPQERLPQDRLPQASITPKGYR